MKQKILLISTCKEKLHEFEFVKPIEDILKNKKVIFKTINYQDRFNQEDYSRIIITGTSLADNDFLRSENLNKFSWINKTNKPLLGICAGMQIISILFRAKVKKQTEIGFYEEEFNKEFLGLKNKVQVYHLHNNYTTLPRDFESFTKSTIPQAIKHKIKPIYGVLFHPEVRNKNLVETFVLG